jgi:hypothetical protein
MKNDPESDAGESVESRGGPARLTWPAFYTYVYLLKISIPKNKNGDSGSGSQMPSHALLQ